MRFLKFLLLHFVINILPVVVIYLVLPASILFFILVVYLISYTITFYYADKFILLFLGAREIIDADHKVLFQVIKGQCFRNFINMPKVYLYSGTRMKPFVLDHGNEWTILLDRNLIKEMDEEHLLSLIDFLIKIKNSGKARVQTKGMGMVAVILKLNYWFLENILLLNKETKIYRIICFISLVFVKPLLEFIFWVTSNKSYYLANDSLKSAYYECMESKRVNNFSEFIAMHLVEGINNNILIIDYLESFPIFENCKFGETS